MKQVGKKRFLGGDQPNLADLVSYHGNWEYSCYFLLKFGKSYNFFLPFIQQRRSISPRSPLLLLYLGQNFINFWPRLIIFGQYVYHYEMVSPDFNITLTLESKVKLYFHSALIVHRLLIFCPNATWAISSLVICPSVTFTFSSFMKLFS